MITQTIKQFEKENNTIVIYLSVTGSKLYGIDTPTSDTDYRGIFISSKEDVCLKQDLDHWKSKSTKEKNNSKDIDLDLWSLHRFMHLLSSGDTNALDLLFSMQISNPIIETKLSRKIYILREQWLHKTPKAFTGYAIQQATKYGLKGKRYKELSNLLLILDSALTYETIIEEANYKYISIIKAPGPRGINTTKDIPYLSVLGKKFDLTLDRQYIIERLIILRDSYGNRTIEASKKENFKALSHATRVMDEITELLTDHHITFPLKNRNFIKQIKQGQIPVKNILSYLESSINKIDTLAIASTLPEKADQKAVNSLLLTTYK